VQNAQPIILTLQLDSQSQAFFDAQRTKHFPPQINYIGAHLTLFHNLPGAEFETVLKALGRRCAMLTPFPLTVTGLIKLGRGVAYRIDAEPLLALRAGLADDFANWLTAQDKERYRPHVTVQNKVAPHEAQALFEHLNDGFKPFDITGEGVQLWFYEGGRNRPGTWAPAGAVAFGS